MEPPVYFQIVGEVTKKPKSIDDGTKRYEMKGPLPVSLPQMDGKWFQKLSVKLEKET